MQDQENSGSVGVVQTQQVKLDLPPEGFVLASGQLLPEVTVAYETYGALSASRDNVIFICHALTGDAHVAGVHREDDAKAGWWDEMIGPGKGIDTNLYHVICANILGGCKGTTGPSSVDPRTRLPYGSAFPEITVTDIVEVHRRLLKQLGIERLAAVVGGSFGGMQALEWTIRHPEMIERCVCVASAASLSTQALAFDVVGRHAITQDPNWLGGDYYGQDRRPDTGLSQARKIGHITYLSPEVMTEKFGRKKREQDAVFQVESYLNYQGQKFVDRFDANSYLRITRAMDEYDLKEATGSLEKALAPVRAKVLVVALDADWLFPSEQSRQLANALLLSGKAVSCCELHAPYGHDAFLVDIAHLSELLAAFLPWVGERTTELRKRRLEVGERGREQETIVGMIEPGTRVVDLGCGEGQLLSILAEERGVVGLGVDIDIDRILHVVDRGHDAFQANIDEGLPSIPDGNYDYAVLSQTLQVVRKPRFLLREMLRIANQGIVTFPNFGRWTWRLKLLASGRMPKGDSLPFEWYDTPNIHLFTLRDFIEVCREDAIRIEELVCLSRGVVGRILLGLGLRNLGAAHVVARISRARKG